jgi:succinyl-CoA synthetase alpha subunit
MSILIDKKTRVIVQGITGEQGSYHARLMSRYGTNIVAGVTPGKGGKRFSLDKSGKLIPVFNNIRDALKFSSADFAISFVPAKQALTAAMDAIKNNLHQVIITEHLPVKDAMLIMAKASSKKLTVTGPNCPGIITPGESKIGIMPSQFFKKGKTGIVSRSGTLTYEIVKQLSDNGFGQSTVIGIGGDAITGLNFMECLRLFEKDRETESVVLIGEIGGDAEERCAEQLRKIFHKPLIAYIAGRTAPEGKTMGHAGAIISGNSGTAELKIEALKKAGALIADLPSRIPALLKSL